MYRRYTSREEGTQYSGAPRLRERIRNILLIFLTIACILLAIFGGRAMSLQTESRTTLIHRMQTESSEALSMTSSLSRTAGASSSATLGRIRSRVYAVDVINQLQAGLTGTGGYLVSSDVFTDIYTLLDDYSDKLTTGTQTGEIQSALTTALTSLVNLTTGLD